MSESLDGINQLVKQMELSVLGQEHVVHSLAIALLANGNVLLEGLPGTAKTRSIKTMAKVMQADLGRIQFTADLLPSDVTGTEIFQEVDGKQILTFRQGPVFNNLVLADEINRAPAKVQGALLEGRAIIKHKEIMDIFGIGFKSGSLLLFFKKGIGLLA